ncbi:MAG: hypothetical protein IJI58_04785 [Bacilli bacterium]|nr:hypothetical protein [Bacilli bacterium]
MAKDSFEYNPSEYNVAMDQLKGINRTFEQGIDDLKKSLASTLGCGTSGPIYDSFCNMYDTQIAPKLRAMFDMDVKISEVSQANQQDYDETTSDIISGFNA